MTDPTDVQGLNQAVQRYFDLMYDSDTSQFDRVFCSTAQLHGLRGGEMTMLSAQAYKDAIARLPSLKSRNIPREEQVLMVDFACPPRHSSRCACGGIQPCTWTISSSTGSAAIG